MEPSQVHVPPVRDDNGPPNLHISSHYGNMHMRTSSVDTPSVSQNLVGGNVSTTSGTASPRIRPSGNFFN